MPDPLAAALDAVGESDPNDTRNGLQTAKIRALLCAYARIWDDSRFHIQHVEGTVVAPLRHVTTGRLSRSFQLAGKLDVVLTDEDKKHVILDHKTTGDSIGSVSDVYWKQRIIEGQWRQYALLERFNGRPVDYVLLNVLRKPSISPRDISASLLHALVSGGCYFDSRISDQSVAFALNHKTENTELYSARLLHDACVVRPGWYFARQRITLVDNLDLYGHVAELWQCGQDILAERRAEVHVRNSRACMAFGTPCQFLNICSGSDTTESDTWQKVLNVHEELPELSGESRNYLTNSRLQMFRLCRRKHHYLYELGIRRQEPSEARDFGILWHHALAAYYQAMKEQQEAERAERGTDIHEQSTAVVAANSGIDAGATECV